MDKREALLNQYGRAVQRLAEVLEQKKNEFIRDSAIKRFEFTYELAWKAIKATLEYRGITCTSPRDCFKEAYRKKFINYEQIWLDLLDMRNETAHTYKEKTAEDV